MTWLVTAAANGGGAPTAAKAHSDASAAAQAQQAEWEGVLARAVTQERKTPAQADTAGDGTKPAAASKSGAIMSAAQATAQPTPATPSPSPAPAIGSALPRPTRTADPARGDSSPAAPEVIAAEGAAEGIDALVAATGTAGATVVSATTDHSVASAVPRAEAEAPDAPRSPAAAPTLHEAVVKAAIRPRAETPPLAAASADETAVALSAAPPQHHDEAGDATTIPQPAPAKFSPAKPPLPIIGASVAVQTVVPQSLKGPAPARPKAMEAAVGAVTARSAPQGLAPTVTGGEDTNTESGTAAVGGQAVPSIAAAPDPAELAKAVTRESGAGSETKISDIVTESTLETRSPNTPATASLQPDRTARSKTAEPPDLSAWSDATPNMTRISTQQSSSPSHAMAVIAPGGVPSPDTHSKAAMTAAHEPIIAAALSGLGAPDVKQAMGATPVADAAQSVSARPGAAGEVAQDRHPQTLAPSSPTEPPAVTTAAEATRPDHDPEQAVVRSDDGRSIETVQGPSTEVQPAKRQEKPAAQPATTQGQAAQNVAVSVSARQSRAVETMPTDTTGTPVADSTQGGSEAQTVATTAVPAPVSSATSSRSIPLTQPTVPVAASGPQTSDSLQASAAPGMTPGVLPHSPAPASQSPAPPVAQAMQANQGSAATQSLTAAGTPPASVTLGLSTPQASPGQASVTVTALLASVPTVMPTAAAPLQPASASGSPSPGHASLQGATAPSGRHAATTPANTVASAVNAASAPKTALLPADASNLPASVAVATATPIPQGVAGTGIGGAQAAAVGGTTVPPASTSSLSAGIGFTPATSAALAASVVAMTKSGQSSLLLRLDPPGLGTLSIHVAMGANAQVNVLFVPAVAQTGHFIHGGMSDLRQALATSGITLGQAQVGGGNGGNGGNGNAGTQGRSPNPAAALAAPMAAPDPQEAAARGIRAVA
jgi:flagellar hook-length control protein FliK